MRIGVISDTHNYLDPRIPALFSGVEHILHGGDIGRPDILNQLGKIAPVTAVSGNTDEPFYGYSDTEVLDLGGVKFFLRHIVDPHRLEPNLRQRLEKLRPHVVIFGHTHKPFDSTLGGVRFFNPGYAGKQRFSLPRTAAILEVTPTGLRAELLPLGQSP